MSKQMRIIAGKFRGRKILRPDAPGVRPTKDRVREALFNMLATEIPGSLVLDLFAGSGAFGLEAVSRGAEGSVFVDSSFACVSVIKRNIAALETGDSCRVIRQDAEGFLAEGAADFGRFDIIFADPPYGQGLAKKTLIMVNQYDILKPSGLLVTEHSRFEGMPETEGCITTLKQKTYRDTLISVHVRK